MLEEKYCYMCEHFVGSLPGEDDYEDGNGMCPYTSVYTNAYDKVCGKEQLFEDYK